MPVEPTVRFQGKDVTVLQGKRKLTSAPLARVIEQIDGGSEREGFEVQPRGARIVQARGSAVAMGLEIPPHTRQVRWLSDDSKAPFGPKAKYADYFVSFPFVVLLIVFKGGSLTGQQQLFYRTESLDRGDELLLPNLYNVAVGYGQQCWVCLQHLPDVGRLTWDGKISAIVDHTFSASFNRSSEKHEGNSYWTAHPPVDPRVASMEAWQEATRADRRMALGLPWTSADTTARAELRRMLDEVVRPRKLSSATELAGLVAAAAGDTNRAAEETA